MFPDITQTQTGQSHYLARPLEADSRSRAYWATDPVGELTVFVHGFMGTAIGSWTQFPRAVTTMREFSRQDVVFFGYDGLFNSAYDSSCHLLRTLDRLLLSPAATANATLGREPHRHAAFRYSKVVLVCHSLGALVARMALIDAIRTERSWVGSVELVLFAPAHHGAQIIPLLTQLANRGALVLLSPGAKLLFPPLLDLEPDSLALKWLQEKSRALREKGHSPGIVARVVVHAVGDRVVAAVPFLDDPPGTPARGRSHMDVCCPAVDYLLPIEAALGGGPSQ